ncbi:hypothetical protein LRP88_11223 [Fusarium phalaenopsidis]
MLSTTFLFALDNTIVADIQPAILKDLDAIKLLPWVGIGFALGTMAVLPWSKVYGIFSIREIYLFNILLFEIGSALCGAAPNMNAMILGRVIAGVGGSGMYSGTLTYVSVCTTMKERASYMAGSTVVWGIGTVLGPVVGGAFAESSATWRWGFYINLVVGTVFAPAYLFLFPSLNPQPQLSTKQKLRNMDWPMMFVFLAGSAFFIMAISFGGTLYNWHSAAEIAFWTLSGVFLVVFVLLLKFHPGVSKEHQLWPSHFLKMPVVMNMQLQIFLSGGIILVDTVNEATKNANIYGYNILIGVGTGCYIVTGFTVVQSLLPAADIANAVAAMAIAQNMGMVLFLSVCGTVFQNTAIKEAGQALPHLSSDEIAELVAGTSSKAFQSLSPSEKSTVVMNITSAIRNVWLLFLVAAALSFALSLPLARVRLGARQK